MPGGKRGLVAPQNTFLENIVRRSSAAACVSSSSSTCATNCASSSDVTDSSPFTSRREEPVEELVGMGVRVMGGEKVLVQKESSGALNPD
ncbi:unnamed protein product [Pleuronectes platessa]|uniref:Uncharacterized protein n=1 Tax=Pleuronectes platessa TaxID=8262 RepID=A0A9N7VXV6_PLEPL|nr:unnamed protein product [Pleuronectes platessa]